MINIADLLLENNTASERPNNDNPIVNYSDNHEKIDNDTKVEDNEPLDERFNFVNSDYFGYYVSDKGNLNGNYIDEDLTYKNEFQAIRFYLNSGELHHSTHSTHSTHIRHCWRWLVFFYFIYCSFSCKQ